MRVGIFTDYPTLAVQSGPAIHTAFLRDNLRRRGHDAVLIGPRTDGADGDWSTEEHHLFHGVPYPTHPKTKVVMPWPARQLTSVPKIDVIHGQINNHMIHYGGWLRKMYRIPMLNTHIIHLPTHSHFLVGDKLYNNDFVRAGLKQTAYNVERSFAATCNLGDGLIVQSRFMVDYWRERGVTVPIETVGRPINPATFDAPSQEDPYPSHFTAGKRLVVVCRHDREKSLDELIEIFDKHVAAADHEITLTLVGDGHEHSNLKALADKSRYRDRIHFSGEVTHDRLVDWYTWGDIFVYTSVSETFGNVVNEALWCGLPCVAYDDRMGVAHQVRDQLNGFLVEPNCTDSHARFTSAILDLTGNASLRRRQGKQAATIARRTSHPDVVLDKFEALYERSIRRVHDEIPVPLCEQPKAVQHAHLLRAVSAWTAGHTTLLGVAAAATRAGLGRPPEQFVAGSKLDQGEDTLAQSGGAFGRVLKFADWLVPDAAE